MPRLIWSFAGRTYHMNWNPMPWLNWEIPTCDPLKYIHVLGTHIQIAFIWMGQSIRILWVKIFSKWYYCLVHILIYLFIEFIKSEDSFDHRYHFSNVKVYSWNYNQMTKRCEEVVVSRRRRLFWNKMTSLSNLSSLFSYYYFLKNSEYDQEIPQSQTADNPVAQFCMFKSKRRPTITSKITKLYLKYWWWIQRPLPISLENHK